MNPDARHGPSGNPKDADVSGAAPESESYTLRVNGSDHAVAQAWLGENLLYVLRERLGLPGSKNACEQGECGSCSVLLDGTLVCSCLVLAASIVGREIVTVEGLMEPAAVGESGSDGRAKPAESAGAVALTYVQRAFLDCGAVQCGFCTPGLVMAVHDLLDRSPAPSELEVQEAISGNLCRCTGYGRILEAVRQAITADDRRPITTRVRPGSQ